MPTRHHANRGIAAALVAALAAQGCGAHVQLPSPPPREAPPPQRLAFYLQHRPVALNTMTSVFVNRYGYAGTTTSVQGVLLGNGTTVQMPEDLHPLVDPESVTAQSAERSRQARGVAGGLLAGGLVATGVGIGLLIPALSSVGDRASSGSGGIDNGLLWTSVGLSLAGAVLALIAGYGPGATASQERVNAFAALDASLRRRLDLCESGLGVVDCATHTPAVPALQPLYPVAPTLPPPAGAPAPWGAPPPPAPTPTPTTPPTPPPTTAVGTPVTL
ncbi:MAG: hypothetical protein U0325_12910 [Polyangiales bacterium]